MRTGRTAFIGRLPKLFSPFLLLMTAVPSLSAEVSIEYHVIARTGVTPIPDGVGTFNGFNQFPAIDSSGNVMFAALGGLDNAGQTQLGIYTALGVCCRSKQ